MNTNMNSAHTTTSMTGTGNRRPMSTRTFVRQRTVNRQLTQASSTRGSLDDATNATELAPVTENGPEQNPVEQPLFEDLFGKAENDDLCSKVEEQEDGFFSSSKCTGQNVVGLALAAIFGLQTWMYYRMNKMETRSQDASQKQVATADVVSVKRTNLLQKKLADGEISGTAKENEAEMKLTKEKLEEEAAKLEQEAVKRDYTELKRKVGAINGEIKYKLCFCKAFLSQTAGCCWHFKNLTKFTFFDWDSDQKCCVTGRKNQGLWGEIMPGNDKCSGDLLVGCATGWQITCVVLAFCIFLITLECCCKSGFEQHCMGMVLLPETDLTTMEEIENWKTSHASFLAKGAHL